MWMVYDYRNLKSLQPHGWEEAMEWANNIILKKHAGYSDWRVPTIKEYVAIYVAKKTFLTYAKK